jgi:hypothetical protein
MLCADKHGLADSKDNRSQKECTMPEHQAKMPISLFGSSREYKYHLWNTVILKNTLNISMTIQAFRSSSGVFLEDLVYVSINVVHPKPITWFS